MQPEPVEVLQGRLAIPDQQEQQVRAVELRDQREIQDFRVLQGLPEQQGLQGAELQVPPALTVLQVQQEQQELPALVARTDQQEQPEIRAPRA